VGPTTPRLIGFCNEETFIFNKFIVEKTEIKVPHQNERKREKGIKAKVKDD